ncbi:uncharacterized protein [Ptychodera flava]|uniref:uncharacterized protein n=1 Tax=Ptychodera flava TaxID=63121 RepID=UPI00396A4D92
MEFSEMDIVGICETAYTVFDVMPGFVRAMKTKNYDNCIERKAVYQNIFRANQYQTEQVPALRSIAVFDYNFTETSDAMIIRDAYSEGHHIFSPYAEQEGAVESVIRYTSTQDKIRIF